MQHALITKIMIIFYRLAYKISYTLNLECFNKVFWSIGQNRNNKRLVVR